MLKYEVFDRSGRGKLMVVKVNVYVSIELLISSNNKIDI